jgi:hypothetical protein
MVRQEQFSSPTSKTYGQTGTVFIPNFKDLWPDRNRFHHPLQRLMVTLYYSFYKTGKPCVRMFCFTGNICHRLSLMLQELKYDIDVPVIVVKKITNVL